MIEFFRRVAQVDRDARQGGKEDGEVGGQPMFSTERVRAVSGAMEKLPKVGEEDAEMWVRHGRASDCSEDEGLSPRIKM